MIDDIMRPHKKRIEPLSKNDKPIGDLLKEQLAPDQTTPLLPPGHVDAPAPDETPAAPESITPEPAAPEPAPMTPEESGVTPETAPESPKKVSPEDIMNRPDPLLAEPEAPLPPAPKRRHRLRNWWHDRTKKQKIIMVIVLVIILLGAGAAGYFFLKPDAQPVATTKRKATSKSQTAPKSTTVASHLTGAQVQPEINQLPVTGVMIENSPDARPQSGLEQAGVVFEAIAEGGITRFLALFQDTQPDYVGPVRSARPYYIQWLQGFDATYAHVGGSPEAKQYISSNGIKDLDQFYNAGAYRRVSNRYAPHNVYTDVSQLIGLAKGKGYGASSYTGFARKAASPLKTPSATKIDVNISGATYNVHYDYDAATNTYKRVMAGVAHTDEKSGKQIAPAVVVTLIMQYSIQADGIHSNYNVVGTGEAYVFQDGGVEKVTWAKNSAKDQIKFTGADGKAFKLNPGQTWITAVNGADKVISTP